MDLKVFISLSENDMPYRKSEPPFILAIKKKNKTVKILIQDQIAFAAVVYFGQVFGFCRLINKSVLKWFLLTTYLNNAYYDKIYPF